MRRSPEMRQARLAAPVLAALVLCVTAAAPRVLADDPSVAAKATLAGGCFWCIEHDLEPAPGVIGVVSGYAGGSRTAPTYQNYNRTDAQNPVPHIEVVEVTYDPATISHRALLDIFVRRIDPTDGGGQFCDRGPGYRPAIFVSDAAEREAAADVLTSAAQTLGAETAVEILDAAPFWPAEDYHQDYAARNPAQYTFYRWRCGRDQRIREVWGDAR